MSDRTVALEDVRAAVLALVGLTLNGRAGAVDMEMLDRGPPTERPRRDGTSMLCGAYDLHIQAHWRLVRDGRILVGYRDVRDPPTGVDPEGWDPNDSPFNRRDELVTGWFAERPSARIVTAAEVLETWDLGLAFDDGSKLEVLPDLTAEDDEYWRLLRPDDHVVVGGFGAYVNGPSADAARGVAR